MTSDLGSLGVESDRTVAGVEATASGGGLRPDHVYAVTGLPATAEQGDVTAAQQIGITLAGLEVIAEIESPSVDLELLLVGAEGTAGKGKLLVGDERDVDLGGLGAAAAIGALTVYIRTKQPTGSPRAFVVDHDGRRPTGGQSRRPGNRGR